MGISVKWHPQSTLDRPSIHPQSTLDQQLEQHSTNTLIDTQSTPWLTLNQNLDQQSSEFSLTHKYQSTLNGMSAKISRLSTDCQLRYWSSVNQVLTRRQQWSVNRVSIESWSRLLSEGITQEYQLRVSMDGGYQSALDSKFL